MSFFFLFYNCRKSLWLSNIKSFCAFLVCAVMTFLFVSNIMTGGLDDETRLLLHQIIQGNITKSKNRSFSEEKSLRLISHNLWCDFLKPHVMWDVSERIEGLAEGIKDFDVALIQEAYILNTGVAVVSKCASLLVKAMEKRGFHYRTSIADFSAPYFGQSGGIVIFSRIQLINTFSTRYRHYSVPQVVDFRGFVIGEFLFQHQHLYVINTHLDPHGVDARVLQAKEIAEAVQNFNTGSHIVVAGDFNIDNHHATTSNRSEEYKKLLETMRVVGLQSVFQVRMETSIEHGNFDAIFTSSNVAVVKKEIIKLRTKRNSSVSDHFGLAVELKLL